MKQITFAWMFLLVLAQQLSSQDKRVSFHVTNVEQSTATDFCTACYATRFTVEGYTQDKAGAVQYVLECVEVIAHDPNSHSVACFRAHARADYMVMIGIQSVDFGSSSKSDPVVVDYDIKSEKEIRKK